jgi:hypothetical protein
MKLGAPNGIGFSSHGAAQRRRLIVRAADQACPVPSCRAKATPIGLERQELPLTP